MKQSVGIRAEFRSGDLRIAGHGQLQIGERDGSTIAISWHIYSADGQVLAMSGFSIYIGDQQVTKDEIIEKARKDIENYRSDRERILHDVKILGR